MENIITLYATSLAKYIDVLKTYFKLEDHYNVQVTKILETKNVYIATLEIFGINNNGLIRILSNNIYMKDFNNNMSMIGETSIKEISDKFYAKFLKVETYIDNNKIINMFNFEFKTELPSYIDVDEYTKLINRENYMREYMYNQDYTNNNMNTDPFYNLIKMDKNIWESLSINNKHDTNDTLFTGKELVKRSWDNIQNDLNNIKQYMKNGTMIAGGKIFSILFGTKSHDIDIFLYGHTYEEAVQKIYDYTNELKDNESFSTVLRTKNALTFILENEVNYEIENEELQIILRNYRTASEILHGFDVDSSSVGYDGENIYFTERSLYAIKNGYNTVNFDRLSKSYELRLAKYGTRGMAVKIPNFDKRNINMDELTKTWNNMKNERKMLYNYVKNNLTGIDVLIFLDYNIQSHDYLLSNGRRFVSKYAGKYVSNSILLLAEESSDYSAIPFNHGPSTLSLRRTIQYLLDEDRMFAFPELVPRMHSYRPLLNNIKKNYDTNNFIISFIPKSKMIYYIKYQKGYTDVNPEYIGMILEIPDDIYIGLGMIRPWNIPQKIELKTINPGEQMTGTFHKIVLGDNDAWYKGNFY